MRVPVAVAEAAHNPDDLLRRELGVRQLAAAIFNYTVGSGIFVLPALVAARLGSTAILAYLVCAVVIVLVAICFAEAGSRVSASGGLYAYVQAAFGPLAGFLAGVILVVSDMTGAAAIAAILAGSVASLLGTTGGALRVAVVVSVLALAAAVNIRGVGKGARLIEMLVTAKLVPLLAFVVVGSAFIRPSNLAWTSMPSSRSVLGAAGVLIFALTGLESSLQPSGEVRDPARTVPRAAFLAIAAVTALYIAIQVVAQGVLGGGLSADPDAPLATAAASFGGSVGRAVMLAGALLSMSGCLASMVLGGPRSLFAFARDGFAPRSLALVHRSCHTPYVAIAAYAATVGALALSGTFEQLVILANVSVFLVYIACAIAAWRLRRRDVRTNGDPFVAPGGPLVPLLTCAAVGGMLAETATRREWGAVAIVVVIALGIYALRARRVSLALRSP